MNTQSSPIHGIALFSGGLDSLLATKLLIEQGLNIHCIHAVSPFFGKPHMIPHWESIYGITIEAVNISEPFIQLLRQRPKYGFGKVLNPCVDCKILMMRLAYQKMKKLGASFIISGEVIGQRPMSQRRDTLNVISNNANIQKILLRPLCAHHLPPTEPESSGLVDRSKLLSFFGRGRKKQLALAKKMGLQEIPTPAGGCRLAERENAQRYWHVLTRIPKPSTQDFLLANIGRQYWYNNHWLCIGRNEKDNRQIEQLATAQDILITMSNIPGPTGLARQAITWDTTVLHDAAALVASYSQQAVKKEHLIDIIFMSQNTKTHGTIVPSRKSIFSIADLLFEDMRNAIKEEIHQGKIAAI